MVIVKENKSGLTLKEGIQTLDLQKEFFPKLTNLASTGLTLFDYFGMGDIDNPDIYFMGSFKVEKTGGIYKFINTKTMGVVKFRVDNIKGAQLVDNGKDQALVIINKHLVPFYFLFKTRESMAYFV